MSGIMKRVLFVEADNRHCLTTATPVYRWADWAQVVTGIGSMAEPHIGIQRYQVENTPDDEGRTNYDFEDMIGMINGITQVDLDKVDSLLSGGSSTENGTPTMGGTHMPRDGR